MGPNCKVEKNRLSGPTRSHLGRLSHIFAIRHLVTVTITMNSTMIQIFTPKPVNDSWSSLASPPPPPNPVTNAATIVLTVSFSPDQQRQQRTKKDQAITSSPAASLPCSLPPLLPTLEQLVEPFSLKNHNRKPTIKLQPRFRRPTNDDLYPGADHPSATIGRTSRLPDFLRATGILYDPPARRTTSLIENKQDHDDDDQQPVISAVVRKANEEVFLQHEESEPTAPATIKIEEEDMTMMIPDDLIASGPLLPLTSGHHHHCNRRRQVVSPVLSFSPPRLLKIKSRNPIVRSAFPDLVVRMMMTTDEEHGPAAPPLPRWA
jgi:hypothetical protein